MKAFFNMQLNCFSMDKIIPRLKFRISHYIPLYKRLSIFAALGRGPWSHAWHTYTPPTPTAIAVGALVRHIRKSYENRRTLTGH